MTGLADHLRQKATQREQPPAQPAGSVSASNLSDAEIEGRIMQAIGQTIRDGGSYHAAQGTVGIRFSDVASEEGMERVVQLTHDVIALSRPQKYDHGEVRRCVLSGWKWAREKGIQPPARLSSDEVFTARRPEISRARSPRWAWQYRLLLGAFNLFTGMEGVGKGTLAAWIIARLTRGELPGALCGYPVVVLIVGDEDSFDYVWTPRLLAAGADLDYVREVTGEDGAALTFPSKAEVLRRLVREESAKVVFFDAFLDNLDVSIDDWKPKAVRSSIAPIRAVAVEEDLCLLATLHINKASGETFRNRVQGSHAYNALARSSLLVAKHPEDENLRVVARGKGNYGARPTSRSFRIEGHILGVEGRVIETSRAVDFEDAPYTADDLLGAAGAAQTSKAETARAMIRGALGDGEWHEASPIIAFLKEAGVTDRAARKAREEVGAETEQRGFPGAAWWRLSAATLGGKGFTGHTGRSSRAGDDAHKAPEEADAKPAGKNAAPSPASSASPASPLDAASVARIGKNGKADQNPFLAATSQTAPESSSPPASENGNGTIPGYSMLRLEDFTR